MTVSDQTARTSVVGTNTVGQEVPFSFPINTTSDLDVFSRVITTGVETTLAETTNYTVTISGDIGGKITMVTAVATTSQIHIIRNTPKTQPLDLEQSGTFNAENLEEGLDRAIRLIVENSDAINRTIRFPGTDPLASVAELANSIDRAGKYLFFDASSGAPSVASAVDTSTVTVTPFMETVLDDSDAATAMATLGGISYTNVKDPAYGATGDGVTDDTAAVQAAITAAEISGVTTVFFPDGTYSLTSLDPGTVDMSFIGQSMENTILFHQEGTAGSPNHLFNEIANVTKGTLRFSNFTVKGTRNTAATKREGGVAFQLYYYDLVRFENIFWLEHNWFPTSMKFCDEVTWINCKGENCARDLFRTVDCQLVNVIGCKADHIGDDVVAAHIGTGNLSASIQAQSVNVIGNQFRDCRGIKLLGQRVASISNNILERCVAYAIVVENASGSEGDNNRYSISITDNVITDVVPRVNGAANTPAGAAIEVSSAGAPRATGASSSVIPGYITAGGTAIYTWDFKDVDTSDVAQPIFHTQDILVKDNIIARTLPAVANYSDWGFGEQIDDENGDFDDPQMTDADMRVQKAIKFNASGFRRVIIEGNVVSHSRRSISFDTVPDDDLDTEQVLISNNIVHDVELDGIEFGSAAVNHPQVVISNNLFNVDPYRIATTSNANGTYTATGNPFAVNLGNCQGVTIANNHFMNCNRMVHSNDWATLIMYGNVGYCNPAAVGFSTSNVGIGYILAFREGFRYVVMDAAPTSVTYLNFTNIMQDSATAQPSSGTYIEGWFTHNRVPTKQGSGGDDKYVLTGWQRLTTGSGHVAGIDWVEARVFTGETEILIYNGEILTYNGEIVRG